MVFEELYQTYADTVYGFLMFKLNDRELVEDILQETFLAVYQASKQNSQIDSPRAWILSIAHNKMVDYLRRNKDSKTDISLDASVEIATNHVVDSVSDLEFKETLSLLADDEKTIVYGLYVLGLSCQELAQLLQIPEGTVKSKSYYARKRLKNWLGGIASE